MKLDAEYAMPEVVCFRMWKTLCASVYDKATPDDPSIQAFLVWEVQFTADEVQEELGDSVDAAVREEMEWV